MKSRGIFIYGLDEETVHKLRKIACDLGLFVQRGTNADGGNLATLLKLIADVDSDQLKRLLKMALSSD